MFSPPDLLGITKAVLGRKGLRGTRPTEPRSYYVWRMARFHGGRDVTMPVIAFFGVHGDPFRSELDTLASLLAREVFGTDMAAAHRWGGLLGLNKGGINQKNLPSSAFENGPVVGDRHKPDDELVELI